MNTFLSSLPLPPSLSFLHNSAATVNVNLIWHISHHAKSRDDALPVWKATDETLCQALALYITVSFFIISWRQIHNPQWFPRRKALLLFTLSFFPPASDKKKKMVCSQMQEKQIFACSINLPVSLDGEIYKGRGCRGRCSRLADRRLVSRVKEMM